jgi:hypothetical protein
MFNHSKIMIVAFAAISLASAGWMAGDLTARADNLAGPPPVCTKGFNHQGSNDNYSCKSQIFKCNAGMSLLSKSLVGNRAYYVCGFPEG